MLIFYDVGMVAGPSTAADEGTGPSIAAEAVGASSDVEPAAEPSTEKDALIFWNQCFAKGKMGSTAESFSDGSNRICIVR